MKVKKSNGGLISGGVGEGGTYELNIIFHLQIHCRWAHKWAGGLMKEGAYNLHFTVYSFVLGCPRTGHFCDLLSFLVRFCYRYFRDQEGYLK